MGFLATLLLNTLREDEGGIDPDSETPPGGKKGRYTPVVRLWREKGSAKLVVEVDGKSLVSPAPLNEIQRDRLEKTAREFRTWLGMGLTSEIESPPVTPSPAPDSAPVPQSPTFETAAPIPAPVAARAPSPAPVAPRQAVRAAPAPVANGPVEKPAPVSSGRSIVMQIEDILQDTMVGTPYEHRGVHLVEDPIRGVIVSVGANNYEGIDAVPDPEIKALIRSAISLWEKSQ